MNITDLEIIAGVNKDEGSMLSSVLDPSLLIPIKNVDKTYFKQYVNKLNEVLHDLDANNITDFYLRDVDPNDSKAIRWRLYDFFGDVINKCPTYKFAKEYAKQTNRSKVFFYELTYSPNPKSLMKGLLFDFTESNFGVFHGIELMFVFGIPVLESEDYSESDIRLSKQIMKHWTDFAKYGYLLILEYISKTTSYVRNKFLSRVFLRHNEEYIVLPSLNLSNFYIVETEYII